ncbi:hypothetical protein [Macellibacteroides fermentans]|uniref:hypothetical protein n=1 Tax=Macellibacteroides fermentans TaxID=879969 RepID=UPI0009265438|nr:hypothetical protein [Macellibacteroides fermentans]OJV90652.1 MAG: hypothetical protein BGO34_03505 [Bacteroidia bacterium 44-10]
MNRKRYWENFDLPNDEFTLIQISSVRLLESGLLRCRSRLSELRNALNVEKSSLRKTNWGVAFALLLIFIGAFISFTVFIKDESLSIPGILLMLAGLLVVYISDKFWSSRSASLFPADVVLEKFNLLKGLQDVVTNINAMWPYELTPLESVDINYLYSLPSDLPQFLKEADRLISDFENEARVAIDKKYCQCKKTLYVYN